MAFILFCFFSILLIIISAVLLKEKKDMERRKPKYRVVKTDLAVINPEHTEEMIHKYDEKFTEREEYRYRQARMKDEFYGEKVYRYTPAYLPVRIEGKDVYSKLDDWVKVGELNDEDLDKLDGDIKLLLTINEYKDVKNTEFKKVKGDPFYTVRVSKQVDL